MENKNKGFGLGGLLIAFIVCFLVFVFIVLPTVEKNLEEVKIENTNWN